MSRYELKFDIALKRTLMFCVELKRKDMPSLTPRIVRMCRVLKSYKLCHVSNTKSIFEYMLCKNLASSEMTANIHKLEDLNGFKRNIQNILNKIYIFFCC